jgi:hypothetical protein
MFQLVAKAFCMARKVCAGSCFGEGKSQVPNAVEHEFHAIMGKLIDFGWKEPLLQLASNNEFAAAQNIA